MKVSCPVVKPFKVPDLVDAFSGEEPFPGMTVFDSEGFGREKTAGALISLERGSDAIE